MRSLTRASQRQAEVAPAGRATVPTVRHRADMLQRSLGNRAVQELHETGAFPLASASHPAATLGSAAATMPPLMGDVLRSTGKPLDPAMRALAESRLGYDFGAVRIHADEQAAGASRMGHARAFTVGPHVVFGAGEYRPQSREGQRLLAHELAHVVQQSRGGEPANLEPGNAPDAAAERAASQFMTGPAEVGGASGVGIARQALQSVNVQKLSDAELEARAVTLSAWFDNHLANDPDYENRLALSEDVFVEIQIRGGSAGTSADIAALRSGLIARSPRTAFELRIRRGELPAYHPVYEKGAVVGYKRSSGGYYEVVDVEGNIVWTDEKPLETPLIDPIDLIPFELLGSLAVKATTIGSRAVLKLTGRVVAKEAGTLAVEEGAKLGQKLVGKVVGKELAGTAGKDVGKVVATDVGKAAAGDVGKAAAGDVGKTAAEALVQVFRKADKVKAVGAVSLKRLRNVLGRAGVSPSPYKLVKVSKEVAKQLEKEAGETIYGWIARDGTGALVKDARGRPIINFTLRGLSSLEEAVKTFGHEVQHIKDFAAGLTTSSEALAERAAEKLWLVVSETIGK